MPYSAYSKDPDAVEDITRDWTLDLEVDTISASTWPVTPSGITVEDTDFSPTSTTIKLSGGTVGQSYRFENHIDTAGGRTYVWVLVVRAGRDFSLTSGPPYATISEAEAIQPAAEGAEALKIEMVLQQSSDWVAKLSPYQIPATALISEGMDAVQRTIPIPKIEDFQTGGIVQIENELIQYQGKLSSVHESLLTGPGSLTNAQRGVRATVPATHALDASVEDVEYPLKARNAELAVFEWLWETRGYKPSRSGVIGSESYAIDPSQIKEIVRGTMGRFYTGGGRANRVGIASSFPRFRHRRYGTDPLNRF